MAHVGADRARVLLRPLELVHEPEALPIKVDRDEAAVGVEDGRARVAAHRVRRVQQVDRDRPHRARRCLDELEAMHAVAGKELRGVPTDKRLSHAPTWSAPAQRVLRSPHLQAQMARVLAKLEAASELEAAAAVCRAWRDAIPARASSLVAAKTPVPMAPAPGAAWICPLHALRA